MKVTARRRSTREGEEGKRLGQDVVEKREKDRGKEEKEEGKIVTWEGEGK